MSIGVWSLREEARKSWQDFISDEIVYLPEPLARHGKCIHVFAEQYLNRDCWLEMHFTLEVEHQGEVHFNSIIETCPDELRPIVHREMDSERVIVQRDCSVFVHCPEFVQLPQGVVFKSTPSFVRLKAIQGRCHCSWEQLQPISVGGIIKLEDGKTDPPLFFFGKRSSAVKMCQSPSQLVQGGSEITDEIPEEHGDFLRHGFQLKPKDVQSIFKVGFFEDGAGLRIGEPAAQFNLKRVEMFLRPGGFYLDVGGSVRCVS